MAGLNPRRHRRHSRKQSARALQENATPKSV